MAERAVALLSPSVDRGVPSEYGPEQVAFGVAPRDRHAFVMERSHMRARRGDRLAPTGREVGCPKVDARLTNRGATVVGPRVGVPSGRSLVERPLAGR